MIEALAGALFIGFWAVALGYGWWATRGMPPRPRPKETWEMTNEELAEYAAKSDAQFRERMAREREYQLTKPGGPDSDSGVVSDAEKLALGVRPKVYFTDLLDRVVNYNWLTRIVATPLALVVLVAGFALFLAALFAFVMVSVWLGRGLLWFLPEPWPWLVAMNLLVLGAVAISAVAKRLRA